MYRILCIYVLCVILSSCFASIKNISPASSEVSSISIVKPNGLPQDYSNDGGYSLCVERANPSEGECSNSILKENKWSDNSTINYDLKNDCPSGYKIKIWLWKDKANTKDKDNIYVLSKVGKESVSDGYVNIRKAQLTGGTLSLNLSFKRAEDGDVVISKGSTKEVNVEIVTVIDDDDSSSSSSSNNSTSQGSKNTNNSSGEFNCGCDTTHDAPPSSGGKKENVEETYSGEAPIGKVKEIHDISEVKAGYPTLVMYGFDACGVCQDEKSSILNSSRVKKLAGKMHVYHVDYYDNSFKGSKSPCGGNSYPQNQFFDKNKKQTGCIVGTSGVVNKIRNLSNVSNF